MSEAKPIRSPRWLPPSLLAIVVGSFVLIGAASTRVPADPPAPPLIVPPKPAPFVPPAPAPTPKVEGAPLALMIDGPGPSIAGELITISAAKSTGVKSVIWHISPGGFRYVWNPVTMEFSFSTRKAGVYLINVVAADANGNLTTIDHDLELLSTTENSPVPASVEGQRSKDFNTLVRSLITTVKSPSKEADAVRLADCFRTAASLVRTDKVSDKDGLERATLDLAKHDLGLGFEAWEPLFVGLDKAVEGEGGGLGRLLTIWNAAAQELENAK